MGGNDKAAAPYNEAQDPCKAALDGYLSCVANHENGLSEGDDCGKRTTEYSTVQYTLCYICPLIIDVLVHLSFSGPATVDLSSKGSGCLQAVPQDRA
jgi:hypothetical protein